MIAFVVMMHSAVTYSGLGSWYYVENKEVDFVSRIVFAFFQTHLQAFFMGLLFMLAGYFVVGSLQRRGTSPFVKARLIRLGIPTLFYILLLHPLSVKLIHTDLNLFNYYWRGIKSLNIFSWNGPMWFAAALLIFSLVYVAVRNVVPTIRVKASYFHLLYIVLAITIFAFILRLFFPIGTAVINFQLGFFASYIIFFILGILAFGHGLFQAIDFKMGKRLLLMTVIIGLPLWAFVMILGGPAKGEFPIFGGLNWQAFVFALWESLACVLISFGLIGIFREKFNSKTQFTQFLADNAFSVYVFHPPILIAISIILKNFSLHPLVKFLFISTLAIPACFIIAALIRKIPIGKKIFS
jgi:peptidoglycan/LPS O-acetylase OafA/YrhL